MNKIKLTILLISTAIFLTACEDPEKGKLDNRVIDYWNFKINKDFKSAYQFLSPGWRTTEDLESHTRRMLQSKVNWIAVDFKNKKCSKTNICEVKIEVIYEYMFRGAVTKKMTVPTILTENWIMKDNTWYNLPIKKKMVKR